MDKLYKLSFASKADYEAVRAELLTDEDGNLKAGIHEIIGGNLPAPPAYDESGNLTNEGETYPDWAVDIISKESIHELEAYIIPEKERYMMTISGGKFETIVKK